jgi:predicted RNA-binding Zn-ribbon protein involved in translation (DUF1610 family)
MSGLNFILSFSVTAAIMAAGTLLIYFHLQGYLVNRNALQMLAVDFGTVKSAAGSADNLCRSCGAVLESKEAALVACDYCGTHNILQFSVQKSLLKQNAVFLDIGEIFKNRDIQTKKFKKNFKLMSAVLVVILLVSVLLVILL